VRRTAALLAFATLLPAALGAVSPVRAPELGTPPEHRRGIEQTFLTYPEWFLVHSPAEYALFVRDHPPSEFPFWGHVRQFWSGYGAVYRETRRGYPMNWGYHVMIMVIGLSTTGEYALRCAYENLVGRLTELTATHGPTEEDRYGARVAQEYVDFIRVRPWYEFDFRGRLKGLWTGTHAWGPDMIRKWERRYALTSEYAAKALYGWLIMKATHTAYEAARPDTAVWLDRLPALDAGTARQVTVLRHLPDGSALVTFPRYDAFKDVSTTVAVAGASFREIAGNSSVILLSALVPEAYAPSAGDRVLFTQPLLTQPGTKRVALVVPVTTLAHTLRSLHAQRVTLEHVYDY
jgi:hypothetical protein